MTPAPLSYANVRLRWCRVAMLAFVRRWGVYFLVGATVFGAGSNNPLQSAGALAAWSVVPLFQAAALPGWRGGGLLLAVIVAQSALGGAMVWALRTLLWPARWGAPERALPITHRERLISDATVVALGLLPLGVVYAVGATVWLLQGPAWLMPHWVLALASLWLLILGSLLAGLGAMQWVRLIGAPGQRGAPWRGWLSGSAASRSKPLAVPEQHHANQRAHGPAHGPAHESVHAPAHEPAQGLARWPVPLCPAWVLSALPLWRGPARRTGRLMLLGSLVLLGVALAWCLGPATPGGDFGGQRSAWFGGWCLAGFALLSLLVSTRVNTLSRAELLPLVAACAVLPLSPKRLCRQRAALALLPCGLGVLGLLAMMLTLPPGVVRGPVAAAFLLACLAASTMEVLSAGMGAATGAAVGDVAGAAMAVGLATDAGNQASRWLLSLVMMVALATEVMV